MVKDLFKSVRNNVSIGVILVTPLVATILVFNFLFNLTTAWLPVAAFPRLAEIWNGYLLRLLTLGAILVALFLVGVLARNFFGRKLYNLGDRILTRIPLVRSIYNAVRKLSEALVTQRKTLFKEVVLIEYPRKGVYSMAFVTARTSPEMTAIVQAHSGRDEPCVNLFLATTPNPTSGFLLLAPRSEVINLDISVGDAMTFLMSAGAVPPTGNGAGGRLSLLDRIEELLSAEPSKPGSGNRRRGRRPDGAPPARDGAPSPRGES